MAGCLLYLPWEFCKLLGSALCEPTHLNSSCPGRWEADLLRDSAIRGWGSLVPPSGQSKRARAECDAFSIEFIYFIYLVVVPARGSASSMHCHSAACRRSLKTFHRCCVKNHRLEWLILLQEERA